MLNTVKLCIAVMMLLLCSCSSNWKPDETAEPSQQTVALDIDSETAILQVGGTMTLTANSSGDGVTISEFKWSFSDGQSSAGKDISVTFSTAGVVTITLEAFAEGKLVGTAESQVAVVAPGALAPESYGFPETLGDVDNDNALTLDDALLAAQAAEGLVPLDGELLASADIDRDGRVTDDDIALMQKAVLRGEALPRALFNESSRPGGVVAMVSPDLLSTMGSVEIRVDGRASPQILRVVRGYASFVVPQGVVQSSSPASVELVVDGSVRDHFDLEILAPVTRPADALTDVAGFLSEIESQMVAQQDGIRAQVANFSLSAEDGAALLAASNVSLSEFRSAREDLVTLMSGEQGARVAEQLQQALYANGLAEFRADGIRPLGMRTLARVPDRLCDVILPSLCTLKRSSELLGTGASVLSAGCSVAAASVFVGGLITTLDGPAIESAALVGFVNICVRLSIPIELAGVVGDLVTPIEPGLRLTADKTTLAQGESAIVRSEITFVGAQNLCGLGLTKGSDALINKIIGEKIVGRLMRNNAALEIMARVFSKIGGDAYNKFLEYVQKGVTNGLSGSQLTGAVADFASGLCPVIQTGAAQAVAENIIQTPAIDEGTLQFLSNGTAQYTCPPPGPVFKSRVDLVGTKELCGGKMVSAKVSMTCATSPVTITMGDNGNALDDIFEVILGGRTILTSSVPTRSVSTTVQLPKGRTEVIMRGLAAPDGVGTYFISFSGAGFVSGDALSGSDLVPGSSKHFIIEVF